MRLLKTETCVLVGDIHLGRSFKTGVPLDRRGEIEETFKRAFVESLEACEGKKLYVQLGDLFDNFKVPYDLLLWTYETITDYRRLDCEYYFIAGNHDLSRNPEDVSAIQVLALMLESTPNVHFVLKDVVNLPAFGFSLVPWSYSKPIEELLKSCTTNCILGHFEEPLNPAVSTSDLKFISGHIHLPHQNGNVNFVGSILPIAFGENDCNDEGMITVTLDELEGMKEEDLSQRRIRVILKDDETLPADINCLQLIAKKETSEEEGVQLEVNLEEFNFEELFRKCLGPSGKTDELWAKYLRLKG